MFNPKAMVASALSNAPFFLLQRLGNIIDGVIVAYFTMIFFCSGLGYLHTASAMLITGLLALGLGRLLDRCVPLALRSIAGEAGGSSSGETPSDRSNISRPKSTGTSDDSAAHRSEHDALD